jgi:hypothetical protein
VARLLQKARTRGELPTYLEPPLDELVRLLKQPAGDRVALPASVRSVKY